MPGICTKSKYHEAHSLTRHYIFQLEGCAQDNLVTRYKFAVRITHAEQLHQLFLRIRIQHVRGKVHCLRVWGDDINGVTYIR